MAGVQEGQRIVIATGGNALTMGKGRATIADQREAAKAACGVIAQIFASNVKLAATHGNGPQVGFILQRFEHALKAGVLHPVPLDAIGADTQGAIGYMMEQELGNHFMRMGRPDLANKIATLVTRVLVDANDPALTNPTKPIGGFMTETEARRHEDTDGWVVQQREPSREDGWRRVIGSPTPLEIVNADTIRQNFDASNLTICGGGGGIPVAKNPDGTLVGVDGAVIDKDSTTALVAETVDAQLLAILTAVSGVMTNEEFKEHGPEGRIIPVLTLSEAKGMIAELQEGSMQPKLAACVGFTERTGQDSMITNFAEALPAILEGKGGTRIIKGQAVV